MSQHSKWIPEIFYEELETGMTSHIPFISVPEEEEMPRMLFVFESRETGEFEPGSEGEELPVTEIQLHQYADMEFLKYNLSPGAYDDVRIALGLEPLQTAVKKGQQITSGIRQKLQGE
jgi:hypothetical protein